MDQLQEPTEISVSIPPDTWHGWIVVSTAFLSLSIVDGFLFNFGQFMDEIYEMYGVSNSELVLSILLLMYHGIGPITSALLNYFGFRVTGEIGVGISIIGIFGTAHATSFTALWLTFGMLSGIGAGIVACTSILVVGQYFDKYRALAGTLTINGTGFGTMIMGLIIPLFKTLEWREKFMIFSSFFLILCPLVATYLSVMPRKVKLAPRPRVSFPNLSPIASSSSTDSSTTTIENVNQLKRGNLSASTLTPSPSEIETGQPQSSKTSAIVSFKEKVKHWCGRFCCCLFVKPIGSIDSESKVQELRPRPIYRDDAFFSHSLQLASTISLVPDSRSRRRTVLSVYSNVVDNDSINYHVSVTRMTPLNEQVKKNDGGQWIARPWLITTRNTLAILLNLKFFRFISFYMIAFAMFANVAGMFIPYLFLVGRVKTELNDESLKYILTTLGCSSIIGRGISCFITLTHSRNLTYLFALGNLFCAIAMLGMGSISTDSLTVLIFLSAAYSLSLAFATSLRPLVYVENYGLQNLTNVYGLVSLFMGCGGFFGPLTAGIINNSNPTGPWPFIFGATCMFIASMLASLVPDVRKREIDENFLL